ncbi:MAG: universal stress protein [Methanoregula sp.]
MLSKDSLMFKKVLFPTDLSVASQKIFHHIIHIPGIQEIILLHIVDATDHSIIGLSHSEQLENAKILLAEKQAFLETFDLKVRIIVKMIVSFRDEGSITTTILDIANTENVSLIIMGVRRKSILRDLFLPSISSEVLRSAQTNVLIIHPDTMEHLRAKAGHTDSHRIFSHILVPTDFSRHASEALAFVRTIQGIEHVILLHVVTGENGKEPADQAAKESGEKLETLSRELAGSGFTVRHHVRAGDPTAMILSMSEEEDVSLIAMSPHGKSWFEDAVIGSTAFAVAHMATKPVLVIREHSPAPP